MAILQLLALYTVFIGIVSLIGNQTIRLVVAIVLGLFASLQAIAIYLTGEVADYKFYEHLEMDTLLSTGDFFILQAVVGLVIIVLSILSILKLGKMLHGRWSIFIKYPIILVGLVFLLIPGNIFANAIETTQLKLFTQDTSFKESLVALDPSLKDYVLKGELTASPGNNLIFLSLESYEIGFINERSDLTPNLNRLKNSYSFQEMKPVVGADWTSGSAYMTQTGMPAFFGVGGNDIFQQTSELQLTTLADVLKVAGYSLTYLIGNKDFAGINDMLTTIGFDVKSEEDFETKYERVNWGIHDLDLFEELKKQIDKNVQENEPFAVFTSTISTHFPDGLRDDRLEGKISNQPTDLEFMVSGIDFLIGDLFKYLEEKQILDNTTVVIVPDHKFMGRHPAVDKLENRSLFLLSTHDSKSKIQALTQLNLPREILERMGVESNVRFVLEQERGAALVNENKALLQQINRASLKVTSINENGSVLVASDSVFIKANNQILYKVELLQGTDNLISFELDELNRITNHHRLDSVELYKELRDPNKKLVVLNKQDQLHVYFTDQHGITTLTQGTSPLELTADLFAHKIPTLKTQGGSNVPLGENESFLTVVSSGFESGKKSEFSFKESSINLTRGLNIAFTATDQSIRHINFDTYSNPALINKFISTIDSLLHNNNDVFIAAHDTAGNSFVNHEETLKRIGLPKLIRLKNREAYIAAISESTREYMGSNHLKQEFALDSNKSLFKLSNTSPAQQKDYAQDVSRFIAHAGGKIESHIYTNSLEALNKQYDQGFRLFELDIIQTLDQQYVAAHDWDTWKKQTGYEGTGAVDLKTFKKSKIFNKFTPLDMKAINKWFTSHPDAILVTDKVGSPEKFAPQFVDKSRLRMEVFNIKDLETAIKLGVAPMVAENIINSMGASFPKYAVDNGIQYAAISRESIPSKLPILKELKNKGIKVFVYHVNFKKGRDEQYVVENELGTVYGMYADQWSFKPSE
ncbi:MAG: sulfatase-like hydrolase/transferase [Nonlabens sp.]